MTESLTAAFTKALDFCDQVANSEDPQICHQLLRLCAGTCRVLHLMKVVPPAIILPFLQRLDDRMVETFEEFMALSVGPLERQQIFLPTRKRGLWPARGQQDSGSRICDIIAEVPLPGRSAACHSTFAGAHSCGSHGGPGISARNFASCSAPGVHLDF